MFKAVLPRLLSFDLEWIPDPMAAEILFGVKLESRAQLMDAFQRMWKAYGATEENPRPYLKTVLCRIVSAAGVLREVGEDGSVQLKLISLPSDPMDPDKCDERTLLNGFIKAIGTKRPQLVGYNSLNADVPILVQRAIVHGLGGHGFGRRPEKPWEGADYFSNAGDYHVDLAAILGRGSNTPRLHEAASLSGIPGKVDTAGDQVWELFLQGKLKQIVDYNEFDALTTHLLWARMAHFGDFLDDAAYEREQTLVRELVEHEIANGKVHLKKYLTEWDRLEGIRNGYKVPFLSRGRSDPEIR